MISALVALAVAAAAAAPAAPPTNAPAVAPPPPADAPAAVGTELWRGAKVGMTPEEVRRVFPAAKPVENGESLTDNAKQLLILPNVRLRTGERAKVSFYFRGTSLNEVKLVAEVPEGQTAANVKRAGVIANTLIPVYGKPTTCGPRQGLLSFECDWVHNGLSVSVTYMDVAGLSPLLETAIRGIVASDQGALPPAGQQQPGQQTPPPKAAPTTRSRPPNGGSSSSG